MNTIYPFYLDFDYINYTSDKLKYETVIPENLRVFVEDYPAYFWFLLPQVLLLPFLLLQSSQSPTPIDRLVVAYAKLSIPATFLFLIVYLVNLIQYLRLRNRCVRLASYGVVIDGTIIEAVEIVDTRRVIPYTVKIRYRYMTLTGYEREGEQLRARPDLRGRLPKEGTPVKVLYADEKAVMML